MLTTIKRAALACGVVGALAAAPPALANAQHDQAGTVSATFHYRATAHEFRHETLTISRGGRVVYRQPVAAILCGSACAPGFLGAHSASVRVLPLDGGSEPEVVLSLYSGGAHCCSVIQVFSYDAATGSYARSQRNFGDPGAQLQDLSNDGRYEFVSADDRFAYRFTDFAASGLPIQIVAFENGRFADVTRQYPKLVAADAATWLTAYKGRAADHWLDSVGVLAAWAADEELLGHAGHVQRYLSAQAKAGHLHSALLPHKDSGRNFVSDVEMFLADTGYIPGEHCM
jgi:hypothetical protein